MRCRKWSSRNRRPTPMARSTIRSPSRARSPRRSTPPTAAELQASIERGVDFLARSPARQRRLGRAAADQGAQHLRPGHGLAPGVSHGDDGAGGRGACATPRPLLDGERRDKSRRRSTAARRGCWSTATSCAAPSPTPTSPRWAWPSTTSGATPTRFRPWPRCTSGRTATTSCRAKLADLLNVPRRPAPQRARSSTAAGVTTTRVAHTQVAQRQLQQLRHRHGARRAQASASRWASNCRSRW